MQHESDILDVSTHFCNAITIAHVCSIINIPVNFIDFVIDRIMESLFDAN